MPSDTSPSHFTRPNQTPPNHPQTHPPPTAHRPPPITHHPQSHHLPSHANHPPPPITHHPPPTIHHPPPSIHRPPHIFHHLLTTTPSMALDKWFLMSWFHGAISSLSSFSSFFADGASFRAPQNGGHILVRFLVLFLCPPHVGGHGLWTILVVRR